MQADDIFIPPTISGTDPVFLNPTVYATTDLTFKITPPFPVYANSKIVVYMPNYRDTPSTVGFFGKSTALTVPCTAASVSGITGSKHD